VPIEASFHEALPFMLATLGQPIFEPLTNAATSKGDKELFYCKASGSDGTGEHTSEGFVVHKGSKGRTDTVASFNGTSGQRLRNGLMAEGVLAPADGMLVFTRDHLFPSPSSAADVLTGRNANGWTEWKTPQGQTLDEVKRQAVKIAD
jgi:Domain of unknown function (DUF4357)